GAFYNLGVNIIQGLGAGDAGDVLMARLLEGRNDVLMGGVRSFLFTAATAGLIIAYRRGALGAARVGALLAAVVAVDLWTIERQYWLFSPPARELYAADPATEHLRRHATDGRVLVLAQTGEGLAERDPYFGGDAAGRGTGLMVHGIRSINGYHGNQLGRYDRLVYARTEQGPITLSPTFWRHENVRYLYTNAAIAQPEFKRLLGPVRNSAGSTVYLYELPGRNPPAWVASTIVEAPDTLVVEAVLDPRFDPARLAVVSDTAPVEASRPTGAVAPATIEAASVTRPTPSRIEVALSGPAPAGSALVVSENYFPGWEATVDGRAARTVRANYNLIGVPLTAGARRVSLVFHDPAYGRGKTLTLVALALSLAAIVAGVLVGRRSARG
ncbi:MAG TPA: YfhO family protein, partial [Gemmatimonadaceae bacterium]|nr:YfhO family protein [Gemmatimonadaceae bacterium]